MNKSALNLIIFLIFVYITVIYCDDNFHSNSTENVLRGIQNQASTTNLTEEARLRRKHIWKLWGWPALAIALLIKIKIVVFFFFVGAGLWGFKYWWPLKSCGHSAPIIYESPPISYHHDHVPYSLDHDHIPYSVDSSSHYDHSVESDPYSGYKTSYDSDAITYSGSDSSPSYSSNYHSIKKRENADPSQKPQMLFEERLGEMVFMFLGLDSRACRRRFICEMEFRSRVNPITAMAFRLVGRGFFGKYTNNHNELRRATSFGDCAVVNAECVFIERNDDDQIEQETTENSQQYNEIPLSNTDLQRHKEMNGKRKHKYSQIGWADS